MNSQPVVPMLGIMEALEAEGAAMVETQAPFCLSMIICDSVVADRTTGKHVIMGTFNNIFAPRFPAVHPKLTIFVELTDGRGETTLTLRLVKVEAKTVIETVDDIIGEPVMEWSVPLTFPDPLATLNMHMSLANVTFPDEGEYRFIMEVDGAFVMERRMTLTPSKQS